MSRSSGGYSIVELLISLVIMSLLLSIGSLSFRDFGRRQNVVGAARQVRANIRLAQTEGLSGNKPTGCTGVLLGYRIRRTSATQYVVEADCGGANIINVRTHDMPSNTTMDAFTPNPPGSFIAFKSVAQGTNLASDVTINIRGTGTAYVESIVISRAGEIR